MEPDNSSNDNNNRPALLVLLNPLLAICRMLGLSDHEEKSDEQWDEEIQQKRLERLAIAASSDYSNLICRNSSFNSSGSLAVQAPKNYITLNQQNISCILMPTIETITDTLEQRTFVPHKHKRNEDVSKQTKRKKELSWSDAVGKNLVQFVEESSIHEPQPATEPSRSSLSRTMSVNSNANSMVQPCHDAFKYPRSVPYDETVRYPRTLPFDGNDPSVSGMTGTDSPQWGWYTHHSTPPTPEYYRRHPRKHVSRSSNTSSQTATTEKSDSPDTKFPRLPIVPQPNPVFKILQKKYKANPHAWNVPC